MPKTLNEWLFYAINKADFNKTMALKLFSQEEIEKAIYENTHIILQGKEKFIELNDFRKKLGLKVKK
jgi:hypothetical protein